MIGCPKLAQNLPNAIRNCDNTAYKRGSGHPMDQNLSGRVTFYLVTMEVGL